MSIEVAQDITGLVLAGGRGTRMGGVDKGLQSFNGLPLALHALLRLRPQVGEALINANRNLAAYESFGVPVWPDVLADYAGPLAGFLTGLERCETPWLLTVPCDTPLLPARPGAAAGRRGSGAAMPNRHGRARRNRIATAPCRAAAAAGVLPAARHAARKPGRASPSRRPQDRRLDRAAPLRAWCPFDRAGDAPDAFFNANTLAELQALQAGRAP